jgi:uncharacterized protein (TIGR04206 family)
VTSELAGTSRRWAVVVAVLAGLVPWVVVGWENGAYPLFSFGFVYPETLSFTSLPVYVQRAGSVPPNFRAWPVGVTLWLAGVFAAAVDVDRRVTAGLLAFAGGSVVSLALALSRQQTVTGLPVGAVGLWLAAGYVYVARAE